MRITKEIKELLPLLQNFPENELTKKIIIPLLEHLGFHKVEFFGGVDEAGKDIICWENDKIGDLKLIVAQVKHFKFTNNASSSKSLQTVVNQITTCFKKKIIYTDRSSHFPKEVYLISTFPIDSKSLLTRFDDYLDSRDQKIKIIDGLKLAELIYNNVPHLIKELMGIDAQISHALKSTLNNEMLLKALGYQNKMDINNIYTDVDFSLGKITTQLFFTAELNPTKIISRLNENEWKAFKLICSKVSVQFPLTFLNKDIDTIENDYSKDLLNYNEWQKKYKREKDSLEQLHKEYFSLTGHSFNEIHRHDEIKTKLLPDQKEAVKLRNSITKQKNKVEALDENDPLNYKVEINGIILSKQILKKREWIENQVHHINKIKPSVDVIKNFINECKGIIDAVSSILSNTHFIASVGFDENKIVRKSFESTRFKLPIEKIFDTGVNIAVLGEAGAGKSTSLQMYAINRECSAEKLFICVPLANVTQLWQKHVSEFTDDQKSLIFDESIALYLIYKGIQMTIGQFLYFIGSRDTVLMLDGIDEAIKSNPWLPKAVNQLSKKYKDRMQIIITSRMSGSYHNEISFFTVTLLPFTTEQRNKFIDNWFEKEDHKIADKIKKHLNKNKSISEIVKNPLLTTTLCVLAKNDVDLPNTEIKLYDDRISLLTGYYDAIKGIESRVTSKPQVLERVAQKLAYCLHLRGKREDEKNELKNMVVNMPLNALSKSEIDLAVNELIDPCNILVPMTDDGKFGFGHLRYQEHLVAKELTTNRSIDLLPLLENIWWRGALVLFAQMNSSLMWLFNEISIRGSFSVVQDSLKEMIKASPKAEQEDLTNILNTQVHFQNKILSQDSEFELDEFPN